MVIMPDMPLCLINLSPHLTVITISMVLTVPTFVSQGGGTLAAAYSAVISMVATSPAVLLERGLWKRGWSGGQTSQSTQSSPTLRSRLDQRTAKQVYCKQCIHEPYISPSYRLLCMLFCQTIKELQ